jgi:hypothetical protein
VEGDARSFRVALVTSELLNARADGIDALGVLVALDWGVVDLPAADYPDAVAGPLLDQVAEQTEEFARHGYRLVQVGERAGLGEALDRYGVERPPAIDPVDAAALRAFLERRG